MRPYGGRDEMLDELRALLHGARRVLMEYSPGNAIPYVSRVDGGTLDVVRSLGVEVLSSADVLASVVAAWDAADLASHERAAHALERAKDGLFAAIKSNLAAHGCWTEFDAQQHLAGLMQAGGLEFDHAPIVAVGPHAGDPHYAPQPDIALPIQAGDLVLTDLWGHEAHRPDGGLGAYADITWVATAADYPPAEQVRVWETVREARDAAVRSLEQRVGAGEAVQGGEVDRVSRGVIEAAGFGLPSPIGPATRSAGSGRTAMASTSMTSRPTTRACYAQAPRSRSSPASTCPASASAPRSTSPSPPTATSK